MTKLVFKRHMRSALKAALLAVSIYVSITCEEVFAQRSTNTPQAGNGTSKHILKIAGNVKDGLGVPMPGVTVRAVSTKSGGTTGTDGSYLVNVALGDSLEFSFVGYNRQSIVIKSADPIYVTLTAVIGSLDEVAVVGYGKQKKISVVGSIQTLKPEELRIPNSNLSNALAGKLAGVIAYQRSGEPGADGSNFYIRGISTFSGATAPLIILDGVAVSSADLNALAPEVIESFSILKDATATAIYGSRGANGVMIVQTKSGKDLDKPRINIRMEGALSAPTKIPKFVSGPQFMELYNEAVIGRSTGDIPYSKDKIEGTIAGKNPYVYPNVNWYETLFKPYALGESFNFNVMGGGKKVDYFMSVTFNHDNGILKKFNLNSFDNNISIKRYSFQNNLNAYLTKNTRISLKLNSHIRDAHGPAVAASTIFANAIKANSVDFPIMFPDSLITGFGTLFGGRSGGVHNNGYLNPFAEMVKGYSNNFQSSIIATIDGEQKMDFVTRGLSLQAMASFKNWSTTSVSRQRGVNQYELSNYQKDGEGTYTYDLSRIGAEQSQVLATAPSTNGDRSLYMQASLNYNRAFEKHNISGLLLYNQQEYNTNSPTDLITSLPRRSQGFAGRTTYAYDNRYLLELNFGYNGSENFAENKRFGFFPSVAVGYVVSNEKFFEPLSNVVSLLKLRGSWGLVGNDQIGGARFVYLSDINLTGQGYTTGVDGTYSKSGPVYNRFANPDITWEVAEKINLGMDLTLLKNLRIAVDVFRENRRDIFLERAVIPDYFGTSGTKVYSNLGKVRNQGIDISADYTHVVNKTLAISMKSTFTFARNKVLANDEPPYTKYRNLSAVGHPIYQQLGYQAERLFIDQAEIAKSPLQQIGGFVQAGDIKYTDVTNEADGLNAVNSDDRVRMGHPTVPEIVYGFGPSVKYKKFDFSVYFQGIANTSLYLNSFHPFGANSNYNNMLQYVANSRWSPTDPNIYATYPRLSKLDNPNNTVQSSYWLRNGAFLKLKSAEIGYTYKFARIYASGLNLLTFSEFKLWDPEQGSGNGLSYPTQRVINIGLQMGL